MPMTALLSPQEHSEWEKRAFLELRQLLYWRWDPIGVSDSFPVTAGEYDSYARTLLGLLAAGMTPREISGYLREVELTWMEIDADEETRRTAGQLISNWFQASRAAWGTPGNEAHREPPAL
ncbi:hypothetical protein [Miltoncostaea oceani]|uniref:hypothetical protein n=1 Tax=Miltoncostaea oceani TaxID=2843216 RepID=UPI001C3E1FEF|nr:hypothetical protein [Miltoncostaea oceani]